MYRFVDTFAGSTLQIHLIMKVFLGYRKWNEKF